MRVLRPVPLTAPVFAPFGTVIEWPEQATARAINSGTSLRTDLLPDLSLAADGGRPCLALFRAAARRFPLPLLQVERHRLGAQIFIPLGHVRYVVVVAAPQASPVAAALQAFVSNGSQGVCLAPGTWHHALLAIDAGDFAVIERSAPTLDCDVVQLAVDPLQALQLQLA
jgi:ureidoglycolate lyase